MSASDLPPPVEALAAVGRYQKFSHAQERGLVAAALEVPYWVIREGREFVLYVEPHDRETVTADLIKYEREIVEQQRLKREEPESLPKVETLSLYFAAWLMAMFWATQNFVPDTMVAHGAALNRAIFAGEWWRAVTALTLHADLAHFLANLFFGLLFGAFLIPRFGAGLAWLGFVAAGALGNVCNAWFYGSEPHSTIGASTAVFGGLGLLVAWELVARWRHSATRSWWQLAVPLGAGLGLLAFLGSGDEVHNRVDYMAHFWGFAVGFGLGLIGGVLRIRNRVSQHFQIAAGVAALLLPIAAWGLALLLNRS